MNKKTVFLILNIFVLSFSLNSYAKDKNINEQEFIELKKFFDKESVKGSILIYDYKKEKFLGFDLERTKKGFLPASTFKIPNSLIGFETKSVDEKTIFKWDGKKRRFDSWEKDMDIKEAIKVSCVPCYQELARKIGFSNMKSYIEKFSYGKMDITENNLDSFWLRGNSKISQYEQILFLKSLFEEKLPVSKDSIKKVKDIMFLEKNDRYKLSGKTGWSTVENTDNGWFVGYFETKDNIYFTATNIETKNIDKVPDFIGARKRITLEALNYLKLL